MEKYENLLEKYGINPTSSRLIILKAIISQKDTFSLISLENIVETIDKSTIFRVLSLFLEKGLIHEVDDGSGSRKYCFCTCGDADKHKAHIHFTCIKCHKTICIKDITVPKVDLPTEYKTTEISYLVKGICPECGHNL